ncbi:MAG: CCA tRNA nucleotidyltransferase [Pontimonas sp.]
MTRVAEAIDTLQGVVGRPPVSTLAEAFAAAGYELALVGGPVRDAFLGRAVNDLDFTTSATPDQIEQLVRPIADAVWDVGREFGTIAAKLGDATVEITTYRADSYDGKTRKPTVEFGTNLDDDLVRRDFTVNAMALRVPGAVLVDPYGGLDDLLARRLRTPSAPEVSFSDDPLRMLRACRFVSQLGATLDVPTAAALADMAEKITTISAERVRDELSKLLLTDSPRAGLEVLVDSGLAAHVLPELALLREERDEHRRHKDVYQHSLTVLDQAIDLEKSRHPGAPPNLVNRLAALLHDIGKPVTKKFEGGQVTFHHHDVVGAKMVKKRLKALRFDNNTVDRVARLIELHLRFFGYADQGWSDSAVRRYVRDAGDELELLHILTRADVTTRNQQKADRLAFAYDDLEQRIAELREQEELNAIRPDLDGEHIMAILGIPPGRDVGAAYRFLLEMRMDEGPLGEEEATKRLLQWWSERS